MDSVRVIRQLSWTPWFGLLDQKNVIYVPVGSRIIFRYSKIILWYWSGGVILLYHYNWCSQRCNTQSGHPFIFVGEDFFRNLEPHPIWPQRPLRSLFLKTQILVPDISQFGVLSYFQIFCVTLSCSRIKLPGPNQIEWIECGTHLIPSPILSMTTRFLFWTIYNFYNKT